MINKQSLYSKNRYDVTFEGVGNNKIYHIKQLSINTTYDSVRNQRFHDIVIEFYDPIDNDVFEYIKSRRSDFAIILWNRIINTEAERIITIKILHVEKYQNRDHRILHICSNCAVHGDDKNNTSV